MKKLFYLFFSILIISCGARSYVSEDAIKQSGYGGEVEQTTYYELYQLRA